MRDGSAAPAPRVVCVTGGKGGVGKSNFSLNFGLALAERGRRVLLVDGDAGLGNLDVLLGLVPARHLGHVLQGACRPAEALAHGPLGVDLLPAASGLAAMGSTPPAAALADVVEELALGYDLLVLDAGAGLGADVQACLRAADEAVVVTTPEPPALADAYATLKALGRGHRLGRVWLVVNMAEGPQDAERAARAVLSVCRTYLGWAPAPLGWLPRDPAVARAVREQRPFLLAPGAPPAARAMRGVAAAFCQDLDDHAPPTARRGLREICLALLGRGGVALRGERMF